ncbi:alanine racemase [Marivirga arenosa]|uniref:Alanine racemase n=1 Tax=Marivirga arenosa TaxID=3059076 RepID=A0AA51ZXZ8_9BACT|nr:alanine racemase [Marivirga sp. BKB1-2]WNB18855.1 alanine racemase [Marivirga sp. BKB1-2]
MKITKPTLLLDKGKCRKNIENMVDRAKEFNCKLRPHFKTHQSHEIGEWFKECGIDSCAVSSLEMAKYFHKSGWKDITVAFPLNLLEIDTVNYLAKEITLNICVESVETVQWLNKEIRHPLKIFIKIDAGYHRTGVQAQKFEEIQSIINEIEKNELVNFVGFIQHAGHSYQAKGKEEINKIHQETSQLMIDLKDHFKKQYPELIISNGDTPSCSICSDFDHIDEMRPGNFVFYDVMQAEIGSCSYNDIAVALACPVVAKHKDRNEIILYGGAIHLSKDRIEQNGRTIYGLISKKEDERWGSPIKNCYMKKLSQEHGTMHVDDEKFDEFNIGDIVYVLPIHSCLTANLMSQYTTLEGEIINMFQYRQA